MNKTIFPNILFLIILFISLLPSVYSIDTYWSGNQQGRSVWGIINASNSSIVGKLCLNNDCRTSWPSSVNTTTFVNTTNNITTFVNTTQVNNYYEIRNNQSLNTTDIVTFNTVSSNSFFGFLNWSWIQNVPSFFSGGGNANLTDIQNAVSAVNTNLSGVNTTTNIMSLGFYNSSYLDPYLITGGVRIYWFTNQTNPAGFKNMSLSLPNGSLSTTSFPITSSKISLGNFITPYSSSNTVFAAGVRRITVLSYLSDSNRVVELQAIVSRCINYNSVTDSCDSIVGFANSTTVTCSATTTDEHTMTYYVPSTYILNASDRFLVNITAVKTNGGNTNVLFTVDDNSFSRIEVPSPVGVTDIASKLDITDQRYNESAIIKADNDSQAVGIALALANNASLLGALNQNSSFFVNNVLSLYAQVQKDPQGFPDETNTLADTHSTLSFNDATRNFSITPVGANFTYYIKGNLVTKTSRQSIVITNTTGYHIIYFDINGNLQETGSLTTSILCDNVIVAIVYWNAPRGVLLMLTDERHTMYMQCLVHFYLHEHLGTQYDSGLTPQNNTVGGSTSLNTSAQIATSAGSITDEDYTHNINAYSFPGNYRVYFQNGSTGNWLFKQNDYPFIYSNDSSGYIGAGGRIAYNLNTGGTWSLAEATSTNFVLFHVLATNSFNSTTDVIVVQGQAQYTSSTLATTGATTEINSIKSSGLFSSEYKPLYTFLVQTNTAWNNRPKAIIQAPSTGGQFIDWRTSNLNGASGTSLAGTVTLVDSGTGLTGGPITGSGVLSVDNTYIQQFNDSANINNLNASVDSTYLKNGSTATLTGIVNFTDTILMGNRQLNITSIGTASAQMTSPGILYLKTGGADTLTLSNTNGYVGVGVNVPTRKLDVAGNASFGTSTATTPQLYVLGGSGGNSIIRLQRTSGANVYYDWALAGGGLSFTQDGSYNVLNLFGFSGSSEAYLGQRATLATSAPYGLLSATTISNTIQNGTGPDLYLQGGLGTGNGGSGDILLKTGTNTSNGTTPHESITRMIVKKNTGYIGVGSNNPQYLMTLNVSVGQSAYTQYVISSTTGQTTTDGFVIGADSSGNSILKNYEDTPMVFYTNNTERMRILNTGYVGIGYVSPVYPFSVSGIIYSGSGVVSSSIYTQNIIDSSTTNQSLNFKNNAGSSIWMSINNTNGFIGMGTVNPSSKLEINGTLNVTRNIDVSGNITVHGINTLRLDESGIAYVWYVNSTVWACYNSTRAFIINNGNVSVSCV